MNRRAFVVETPSAIFQTVSERLSEKPQIGPRGGPARGQKGPLGPFDRPYTAQIHARSVAPNPFSDSLRRRILRGWTSVLRSSRKVARRRRAFSQEGGIGVARLNDSSSSEARMIAECVLCTRLSCDAGHSSSASSMAAVLTTSWLASTSLVSRFCCSRAVFRSTGLTQFDQKSISGLPD